MREVEVYLFSEQTQVILMNQLRKLLNVDFWREIDTPYSLLHLFLRMKYEKRGWCKLEDCKEVAKSCGISGDDLFEALKYLHDRFGTVLYY